MNMLCLTKDDILTGRSPTEYQEVVLTSDNDGHDYLIPFEMEDQFDDLLENEIEDEFEDLFSQYRTGGGVTTKLYAKVGYQNEQDF